MTEMNEQTQYRVSGAPGADGTAAWPDAGIRAPLMTGLEHAAGDQVTENDRRVMNQYGITYQNKTVYTYKTYVYDRLADALAYARIDSARVVG